MGAPAPRPPFVKLLLPMGVAAVVYAVALTAAFVGWAVWQESQRSGYCGADCGRGYGIAFALGFGILGAPVAGTVGALAEFAAPSLTRRLAHGIGIAIVGSAALMFHQLMVRPFG